MNMNIVKWGRGEVEDYVWLMRTSVEEVLCRSHRFASFVFAISFEAEIFCDCVYRRDCSIFPVNSATRALIRATLDSIAAAKSVA